MQRTRISKGWAALVLLFAFAGSAPAAVTGDSPETRPAVDVSAAIPDSVFRAWVLAQFDTDGDSLLSPEETAAVTRMVLPRPVGTDNGSRIVSLEGIALFPALAELNCSGLALSELDVTGCASLVSLDCSENDLTALALDSCAALSRLMCYGNRLSALDLSGCPALQVLLCRRNALTALDLSRCPALARLDCSGNALTALDASRCPAMSELMCHENRLTRLEVAGCRNLFRLMCYNNALTELDLFGCEALETLACSRNRIASLDLGDCALLSRLICSSNRLTRLDLTPTNMGDDDERRSLWCSDNPLEELLLPAGCCIPGVTEERSADCIDPSTRIEWAD